MQIRALVPDHPAVELAIGAAIANVGINWAFKSWAEWTYDMREKLDMIADMTVKKPWRSLCACYGIIVVVIVWGVYLSGAIVVPSGFYEW